jgi:hypothetical protein
MSFWEPTHDVKFVRRRSPDGTFDSICSECRNIIAMHMAETDLEVLEAEHVCDEQEDQERIGRLRLSGLV